MTSFLENNAYVDVTTPDRDELAQLDLPKALARGGRGSIQIARMISTDPNTNNACKPKQA
jgi:hypothetical protein